MKKRTILTFTESADVWNKVDNWAKQLGYKVKASTETHRLLQKGVGFWVAPRMLQIDSAGGQITLQAWIRAGLFVRICALFILPAEMHIGSGGFKGVLPRKMQRTDVNKLLKELGQPDIE